MRSREVVPIKTPEEIKKMRVAGKLASEVLDYITPYVQAGVTTNYLDLLCHDYIVSKDAIPAPLHYQPGPEFSPFPKSICTSVNNVVCHGIPSDIVLKSSDIINIDVTVIKDGFHGDCSRMFTLNATEQAVRISQASYLAMWAGIFAVKDGALLSDIGKSIQAFCHKHGYSVVRDFCGHGIGRKFHEPPQVLHYDWKDHYPFILKSGMTFTIEPMINQGRYGVKVLSDGWTAVTKDRSLSAQWEHTILVTQTGYEVLT